MTPLPTQGSQGPTYRLDGAANYGTGSYAGDLLSPSTNGHTVDRSIHSGPQGYEKFTSIDLVENNGRDLVGAFHSDQWGDLRAYFKFQLSPTGKIKRLDIG